MTEAVKGPGGRTPYFVKYRDLDGNEKTIRRVPPAKLHQMEVKDKVTISRKKSDVWDEGDEVRVVGVTARQPNVLQVENAEGKKTFLPYFDVQFKEREGEEVIFKDGKITKPAVASKYLLWP